MIDHVLDGCVDFVTEHNRLTILLLLVVTGGMVLGVGQLNLQAQAGADAADFQDLEPVRATEYVEEAYGGNDSTPEPAEVYVRSEEDDLLSKEALLDSLAFQQSVLENESLASALVDRGSGVLGVANIVGAQAAGDPTASLDEQIAALEDTSAEAVRSLAHETIAAQPAAQRLMALDYESGETAHDRRMIFLLDGEVDEETRTAAQAGLFEAAEDREQPNYFTLGEQAAQEYNEHLNRNTIELILPIALALILIVLAFAYRDLVDVVVGMTGVVLSVVWMFGLLGWLGVAAGTTMIIGVVLIGAISIDFGFHVFNRYREQRGSDQGIRGPMNRGVRSLTVAFGLVTLTAGIGFLSNLANPLALIRELGVAITLGVVASFVVFTTIVPALKVSVDGLLERLGLDRRKRPLGHGRFVEPILAGGVRVAKVAAPIVVIVALVAGGVGAVAWTNLDQESFQQQTDEPAEWKQTLPGPMAWEPAEFRQNLDHVLSTYGPALEDETSRIGILVEGDVAADGALGAIRDGVETARDRGVLLEDAGVQPVTSPLSVVESAAASDESFADAVEVADADGDGVPNRNLDDLYDRLFDLETDAASQVLERSDGEYESARLLLAVNGTADFDELIGDLIATADAIEGGSDGLSATVVGQERIQHAILDALTDGILGTMIVALGAVFLATIVFFRLTRGSATLGAVVAVPIALVTGMVVGGMYLLDVPLTLLTALLMSLVIGVGIDYSIHVGDRFAEERARGRATMPALRTSVTGTGGALLGSTVTSVGAFATLAIHPHPQIQSLGTMVVLALSAAFVAAVFVLPSLLVLYARGTTGTRAGTDASEDAVALQD